MAVKLNLEEIIAVVAHSVVAALGEVHTADSPAELKQHFGAVAATICEGRVDRLEKLLSGTPGPRPRERVSASTLRSAKARVLEFTRLVPALGREEVSTDDLRRMVDCLYELARGVDALGNGAMAFNLVASAQGVAANVRMPHLRVAEKLKELADANQPDQLHAACWAYAAERVRSSVERNGDWLRTLDAVELALAVRVSNPEHQKSLTHGLLVAMKEARATDFADVLALCFAQIPAHSIEEAQRTEFNRILADMLRPQWRASNDRLAGPPNHVLASVESQMMVDDLRMRLTKPPRGRPSLAWLDMRLTHPRLAAAVPMGPALIFDANRTGEIVMELIHEVTHAYCLNGPIGFAVQANRAAVRLFEVLLTAGSLESPPVATARNFEVASSIPEEEFAGTLAEAQLAARLRSAKTEATWLPWLEGVAQYVELLADPTENPNEILSVHEAVRSVVDFEFKEIAFEQAANQSAERFDSFVAEALSRLSRHRHVGYLFDTPAGRVYLLGYVVVRSVVARWEATLARRIKPIYAAKLLVDATQRGCLEVIERQLARLDPSFDDLTQPFVGWLHSIASIDAQTLNVFFEDVNKTESGHRYAWVDGRPHRVESSEAEARLETAARRVDGFFEDLCRGYVSPETVFSVPEDRVPDDAASLWTSISDLIGNLFRYYVESNRFLPVGRDEPRLIFFEGEQAIALSTRTYADRGTRRASDRTHRYCVVTFQMAEGEVEELRSLCGRTGTSRGLATRVIDLVGDDIRGHRPASYVCLFFGDGEWERIGVGREVRRIGTMDDKFLDVLRRRVFQSPLVDGGERALGSLEFLASRLPPSRKGGGPSQAARDFDPLRWSEQAARLSAAEAFSNSTDGIYGWARQAVADRDRCVELGKLLQATGTGQALEAEEQGKVSLSPVFSSKSCSGVAAFGGQKK